MLNIPDKNNNQNRGLYASQKYHGRRPKTIKKAISKLEKAFEET